MQLPLFISDQIGLLDDLILSLDVRVGVSELHNRLVSPLDIALVQEHAMGKLLLDVTDLDGHVG